MDEWISEARGRVLVLLGAGASKPNLPTSAQLLDEVSAIFDADFTADLSLHHLWREIRPRIAAIGADSGNIEDAYEAIRTLTYQDSDPTRYWIEGFTPFDFYGDDEAGRRELASDANILCDMIRGRAIDVLAKGARDAPLDHFEPLLRAKKTAILSLNYDDLLEQAARQFDVPLATGAELWDGGFGWQFPDDANPLIKLHGSYLWRSSRSLNPHDGGLPNIGLYEMSTAIEPAPNRRIDSTVMFGAGLKLTPHGPFPALMRSFTDYLEQAELVVAVGYRFADEHVNAAIYRWASLDSRRRIMIVDPLPLTDPPFMGSTYASLLSAMWADYRDPKSGVPGYAGSTGDNRLRIVKKGVVEALPELFGR